MRFCPSIRGTLLCIALLFSAGCDAFFGIGPTEIYGRVVDAESGEPMDSVRVGFVTSGGMYAYHTVAWTLTDGEGRFRLEHDFPDGNWPLVWVNALGTMEEGCYFISHAGLTTLRAEPGERTRLDVELPRNSYYDPEGKPASYPSPVECRDWSEYDL
jgi:hypothetical protein